MNALRYKLHSVPVLSRVSAAIVLIGVALWAISCAAPQLVTSGSGFSSPSANSVNNAPSQIIGKSRTDVITYTVQAGENLFSIADKFNLHPETILWANEAILASNPRNVSPGLALTILPINGVYYRWRLGDSLAKVAERFGAKPEDILNWPSNHLDPQNLNIPPGTLLIIPGGHPLIPNANGITVHTP